MRGYTSLSAVYPGRLKGRPFLLHGMFLYSSSLISLHTAFLLLSLLKLEALIGRWQAAVHS